MNIKRHLKIHQKFARFLVLIKVLLGQCHLWQTHWNERIWRNFNLIIPLFFLCITCKNGKPLIYFNQFFLRNISFCNLRVLFIDFLYEWYNLFSFPHVLFRWSNPYWLFSKKVSILSARSERRSSSCQFD